VAPRSPCSVPFRFGPWTLVVYLSGDISKRNLPHLPRLSVNSTAMMSPAAWKTTQQHIISNNNNNNHERPMAQTLILPHSGRLLLRQRFYKKMKGTSTQLPLPRGTSQLQNRILLGATTNNIITTSHDNSTHTGTGRTKNDKSSNQQ
jgi:hypothetical protein